MANLGNILNKISQELKGSKIETLIIKGSTKNHKYTVHYSFKDSKYCVVFSNKISKGLDQHVEYFGFPREVVQFIKKLKW